MGFWTEKAPFDDTVAKTVWLWLPFFVLLGTGLPLLAFGFLAVVFVGWGTVALVRAIAQGVYAVATRPRKPAAKPDKIVPLPLPPPPTREELAAEAKERYESTLQFLEAAQLDEAEREAGRLRAKQQYLRELDDLMH